LTRRPRPTRRNAFRPKTAIGPILAGTRRGGNNSLEGEPVVQPVVEPRRGKALACTGQNLAGEMRSEEHTSELQSLMRISYAVFCLTKKKRTIKQIALSQ